MLLSKIPEQALTNQTTSGFAKVLSELNDYKKRIIDDALQGYNYGLLYDRKWVVKRLGEYGINGIPNDYPLEPLRQLLLNINVLLLSRGSKIGLEALTSVLTLGYVVYDDTLYFSKDLMIHLDSITNGFLSSDSEEEHLYLCDTNNLIRKKGELVISINSPYLFDSHNSWKEFLERMIAEFLTFNESNVSITFYVADKPFFHEKLNKFFTKYE